MSDLLYISRYPLPPKIQTPHMLYSETDLKHNCSLIKEGFIGAKTYFAVKSCYAPPVLSTIAQAGFGAEVMSAFEYTLARHNGFSPDKIILNGLGRSSALLETAAITGSTIIIDSAGDLDRIKELAQKGLHIKTGIRLRINHLETFNTPYNNLQNKLGISTTDALFEDFIDMVLTKTNVKFDLLHTHFTINEKTDGIYLHALKEIERIFSYLLSKYPRLETPKNISIGGGFYPFEACEKGLALSMFSAISERFKSLFPSKTLCVEPGRLLTNSAGYVLTKVIDTKTASGHHHIIVDAGTNVLIPLPSAHYALQNDDNENPAYTFSLADGITSPDNVILKDAKAQTLPVEGDLILLKNCGAYTDVLSEFWVYTPYAGSFLSKQGDLIPYRNADNIRIACQQMWGTAT